MTSEPKAPGAPAIILYRQLDRDDSSIGKIREDHYYRIKIFTEDGRKNADIEIPFVKGMDHVTHIQARTIKPDGSIVDFDGKVTEKSLLKARRWRVLAKTFTLPAVEPGCVIEYMYTIELEHAYGSHWILSESLFTRDARFSLKPFKGGALPLSLRWSWQNIPKDSAPVEGPDHVFRMEARDVAAFQTEDFMPPADELKSRVDFVYETALKSNNPDEFWKGVGQTRNAALERYIDKPKAMREALSQIISPNDAPEAKLRKIYDRVQKIRNTTYEIRKSTQEEKRDKEKLAENIEDVWKHGYGSRVELNWLYLALVRAAGFEAYGCWVADRRQYFFSAKTMQSGKLDASVVLVKLDGKDLYFDPGGAFTPYGLLTWSETGVRGLKLDNNGGTWIVTYLPRSSESQIVRHAKFALSETGDLEGKLTLTYTGLEAMYYRTDMRNADDVARKKFLEDAVKSQVPGSADAQLTNQPDWSSSETPLVAEFNLKIPGWASNAGHRMVLPAGIFVANEKHLFEHANRVYPIYFEYPMQKVDNVSIELPAGWKSGSLPKPQIKNGHIVEYSLSIDNDKGVIHVSRKMTFDFLLLEVKYYASLRDFFQQVRSGDEAQILLDSGATSASN